MVKQRQNIPTEDIVPDPLLEVRVKARTSRNAEYVASHCPIRLLILKAGIARESLLTLWALLRQRPRQTEASDPEEVKDEEAKVEETSCLEALAITERKSIL